MKFLLLTIALITFHCTLLSQFNNPYEITENHSGGGITVDFDQDGNMDFVDIVRNLFLFRNDGSGHFEKIEMTSSWTADATQIYSADMNGDGYPDILSRYGNGKITCRVNNGNLDVGGELIIDENLPFISKFQLIDFNQDNKTDILIVTPSNTFRVYINEGNMLFTPIDYAFVKIYQNIADMNGDGSLDLVLNDYGSFQIRYNDGSGNFDDSLDIPVPPTIYFNSQIHDLDLDGNPDVISLTGNNLRTLKNNGAGQFTAGTVSITNLGNAINNQLLVKDINGDGYPDALITGSVSNYTHAYLLNDGSGNFASAVDFGLQSSPALDNTNNGYIDFYDFDNNGFPDLLTKGPVLFKSSSPMSFDPGIPLFKKNPSIINALMDVNEDGIDDLVFPSKDGMYYQLGQADGSFSETEIYMGTLDTYSSSVNGMITTDFNLDGKQDLYYSINILGNSRSLRLFVNQGGGVFTPVTILNSTAGSIGGSYVGDIDNDNLPDILYRKGNSIYQIDNLGNTTFSSPVIIYTDTEISGYTGFQDVNGDNYPDIILYTAYSSSGYELFYLPNTNGNFGSPVTLVQQSTGNISSPVIFTDINNDGDVDLIYNHWEINGLSANDRFQFYYGDGQGQYSYVCSAATNLPGMTQVVDINKDGLTDICVIDGNAKFSIHFQDNSGTFSDAWYYPGFLDIRIYWFTVREYNKDVLFSGDLEGIYLAKNSFKYAVHGNLYTDDNSNGDYESTDTPIPSKAVHLSPADHYDYSTSDGSFMLANINTGTNQVSPPVIPNFNLLPPNEYQFVSSGQDSIFECAFGYTPNGIVDELSTMLNGSGLRCNLPTNYWIDIQNTGTTYPSGIIALKLDTLVSFISSDISPDSISSNTLYWHYSNLNFFSNQFIHVIAQSPDYTHMGETLFSHLYSFITDQSGVIISVFEDSLSQVVTCSYDPNDKRVTPAGIGAKGYVPMETEWLEYTVRFQNTGNDTAIHVVVRDQLDTGLDWSSLELLSSSHTVSVHVDAEGLTTFAFNSIYLPDSISSEAASHGYVTYRVRLKNSLPPGRQIRNYASIYFDYNPPVLTNTVLNTLYSCANIETDYLLTPQICEGTDISASVETTMDNADITWTLENYVQNGSYFSWIAENPGTHNLQISIQNEVCVIDTTIQLNVSSVSEVTIGDLLTDTICAQSGSFALPTAQPAGGVWTGPGVSGNSFDPTLSGLGEFSVLYTYTSNDNCQTGDSLVITVEECLGLSSLLTNDGVSVYPNPFGNYLIIESDEPIYNVQIFGIAGNLIFEALGLNETYKLISLPEISSGTYLIHVTDNQKKSSTILRVVRE